MIKALIIDDEPSAVNTLRLMLKRYVPEITDIQSTNDAQEGILLIKSFQPALLFLDIQMPVITGFELLKKLPAINLNIIFTTAHDQFAIQAIRFSALDYLLKPIDADELKAAVQKFIALRTPGGPLYNNLLTNITAQHKKDYKLALPTSHGTFFYKTEEIVRLEGEGNYTKFFFTGSKSLLTSRTMKEYEDILSSHGFIRTHKSHIVNQQHVINLTADGMIILTDGTRVEISRRRREEVSQKLKSM